MNSRNIASILKILFWGVIALIASLLLLSFYRGENPFDTLDKNEGPLSVLQEETISEDITSIIVNWSIGGVVVNRSNDDKINLVERSYDKVAQSKWASTTIDNKTLKINSRNKNSFFFFWHRPATYLELQLPAITYETFKLNVTSGQNEINGISAILLDVDSTSGSLTLRNLEAETFELDMTSGDTDIADSTTHAFVGVMTSGDMTYKGIIDQRLDLTMTSGQFTGELHETPPQSIDFEMTSGQAHFKLPGSADFLLTLSKTTGSFTADFDSTQNGNKYTYKNGRDDYRLDMTSGSLTFAITNE